MRKFIAEFKEFISRGNVMDMAVGIIIGTAFTAIVNSLVNDIVMPVIGLIIGGMDFTSLKVVIAPATASTAEVAISYGVFLQNVINFVLIALVVFIFIIGINRLHRKEEKSPEAPPADIALLTEIRDLLKEEKEK